MIGITTTREKIIVAMYDLLAEKSYDKASIGQIAEMIGIKKASVYYYFRYKEEILLELVKELYSLEQVFVKIDETINSQESYSNYLLSEGNQYIDSYSDNLKLHQVFAEIDAQTNRIPALKEFVQGYNQEVKEKWQKILVVGIEVGVFPADFDVTGHAEFLFTVLTGIDDGILCDLPIDAKRVWAVTVKNLLK